MEIVWIIFLMIIFFSIYYSNKNKEYSNKTEEYEEYNEDLEEYNEDLEEDEEKDNKLRSKNMNYDKLTKKELIELIEQQNKKIEELEKKSKKEPTSKATNNNSPISFEIINFYANKDRIELLWTNNSSRSIHFIKGTLKFYDKNNKLLGVDSKHICSDLNPYTEKAEVLNYLKIPVGTTSVNISISNIYYH